MLLQFGLIKGEENKLFLQRGHEGPKCYNVLYHVHISLHLSHGVKQQAVENDAAQTYIL
jgi:hypothetical protein